MANKDSKKVELIIKSKAHEKLRYYVEECPAEISGFGRVRKLRETTDAIRFELYDVEILPQKVSGADANITQGDIAEFMTEKMKKRQSLVDYKLWWHSHAVMKAFFSVTDDTTINTSSEFSYLISLVTNKAGDYECRLDVHNPVRMTVDVNVLVEPFGNERLRAQIVKEIEEKVVIASGWDTKFGFKPNNDVNLHDPKWWQRNFKVGQAEDDDNEIRPGETDKQYFERISGGTEDWEAGDDEYEQDNIRKKGRGNRLHTGMH